MTNEEAISVLNDYDINFERHTAEEVAEAHEMAIKALKPQPSEDCISRKAVLDGLHRYFAEGFNEDRWWNSTYVLDTISKAPSVAPQPNIEQIIKTTIKEYLDKEYDDVTELLLALNKDLCERIRKEK